jgi:hypothetical protein
MAKSSETQTGPPAGKAISAKEAVVAASEYLAEVAGVASRVSVEEIELNETGSRWLITLGYFDTMGSPTALMGKKSYKIFDVDAKTGEVVAMKIREV